jgi:hypothetical protein
MIPLNGHFGKPAKRYRQALDDSVKIIRNNEINFVTYK